MSRQPNGTAIYHDVLPAAGARFIDMKQFPQALGFKLPSVGKVSSKPKPESILKDGDSVGGGAEVPNTPNTAGSASVIGLDFLLGDVVGGIHGLDFESFTANDRLQPLHVVVSSRFFIHFSSYLSLSSGWMLRQGCVNVISARSFRAICVVLDPSQPISFTISLPAVATWNPHSLTFFDHCPTVGAGAL